MSPLLVPTSTAASEHRVGVATPAAQWTDVTVLGDNDWLRTSLERLERIESLEADWDGFGSPAPDRFLIRMADTFLRSFWRLSGFLPVPSVVPVPGGSLQLEWTNGEKELEFELALQGDRAACQVRVLRTLGGEPEPGDELNEPKDLVPHLLWLIER